MSSNKHNFEAGDPLWLSQKFAHPVSADPYKAYFVKQGEEDRILVEVEDGGGWGRDWSIPDNYTSRASDTYWWCDSLDSLKLREEEDGSEFEIGDPVWIVGGDIPQSYSLPVKAYFIDNISQCDVVVEMAEGDRGWERSDGLVPHHYESRGKDNYWTCFGAELEPREEKCVDFTDEIYYTSSTNLETLSAIREPDPNRGLLKKALEKFNPDSIMSKLQKVPKMLKRALDPNLRKQYRAGLIDGDLELTGQGKYELLMVLQEQFSDELTKVAEEIIEEEEENN